MRLKNPGNYLRPKQGWALLLIWGLEISLGIIAHPRNHQIPKLRPWGLKHRANLNKRRQMRSMGLIQGVQAVVNLPERVVLSHILWQQQTAPTRVAPLLRNVNQNKCRLPEKSSKANLSSFQRRRTMRMPIQSTRNLKISFPYWENSSYRRRKKRDTKTINWERQKNRGKNLRRQTELWCRKSRKGENLRSQIWE